MIEYITPTTRPLTTQTYKKDDLFTYSLIQSLSLPSRSPWLSALSYHKIGDGTMTIRSREEVIEITRKLGGRFIK